jgi:hypothetical protein
MKTCLLLLLPLTAAAGPYKSRINDSLDALDDARSILKKSPEGCRSALGGSLKTLSNDLEDVRGGASTQRLQELQLAFGGVLLATGLSDCPRSLGETLQSATAAFNRAQRAAAEREDDEDRDDRRRRRRDRDDEDEDDDRPRRRSQPEPMAEGDFAALVSAVSSEVYGQQKLSVVQSAKGAYFTVSQVGRLVDEMTYGKDKVQVVALLNDRILDKQNAFQLYGRFTYSSDKEQVKKLLAR